MRWIDLFLQALSVGVVILLVLYVLWGLFDTAPETQIAEAPTIAAVTIEDIAAALRNELDKYPALKQWEEACFTGRAILMDMGGGILMMADGEALLCGAGLHLSDLIAVPNWEETVDRQSRIITELRRCIEVQDCPDTVVPWWTKGEQK